MIEMEIWYKEAQDTSKDLSQEYPHGGWEAFEGSLSGDRVQAWLFQALGEQGVQDVFREYPEEDQAVAVILDIWVDEADSEEGNATRILRDFLSRTGASLVFMVVDTRGGGSHLMQWYEDFGFRQFGKTEYPPGHPVMVLET